MHHFLIKIFPTVIFFLLYFKCFIHYHLFCFHHTEIAVRYCELDNNGVRSFWIPSLPFSPEWLRFSLSAL